jgi:Uma2 family endonuclease
MVQLIERATDFDEFIAWLPERSQSSYELHNGEIVEMPKPKGKHSQISAFIASELVIEIRRLKLDYFIPRDCIVKSIDGRSGFEPDITIADESTLVDEPRWEQESIIARGITMPLVVEIVSTNWQDDYWTKFFAYQELGIAEYWIVDYLGLGGRRFIGKPKQPTISICQLVEGEYDVKLFRDEDVLQSAVLPELELTADRIFAR